MQHRLLWKRSIDFFFFFFKEHFEWMVSCVTISLSTVCSLTVKVSLGCSGWCVCVCVCVCVVLSIDSSVNLGCPLKSGEGTAVENFSLNINQCTPSFISKMKKGRVPAQPALMPGTQWSASFAVVSFSCWNPDVPPGGIAVLTTRYCQRLGTV